MAETDRPNAKQVAKNLLRMEQYDWPHLSVAVCGKPAMRSEVIGRLAKLLYEKEATVADGAKAVEE